MPSSRHVARILSRMNAVGNDCRDGDDSDVLAVPRPLLGSDLGMWLGTRLGRVAMMNVRRGNNRECLMPGDFEPNLF